MKGVPSSNSTDIPATFVNLTKLYTCRSAMHQVEGDHRQEQTGACTNDRNSSLPTAVILNTPHFIVNQQVRLPRSKVGYVECEARRSPSPTADCSLKPLVLSRTPGQGSNRNNLALPSPSLSRKPPPAAAPGPVSPCPLRPTATVRSPGTAARP